MHKFKNAIRCIDGDMFAFELRKRKADAEYGVGNPISRVCEETLNELWEAIEVLKNHEE